MCRRQRHMFTCTFKSIYVFAAAGLCFATARLKPLKLMSRVLGPDNAVGMFGLLKVMGAFQE